MTTVKEVESVQVLPPPPSFSTYNLISNKPWPNGFSSVYGIGNDKTKLIFETNSHFSKNRSHSFEIPTAHNNNALQFS